MTMALFILKFQNWDHLGTKTRGGEYTLDLLHAEGWDAMGEILIQVWYG